MDEYEKYVLQSIPDKFFAPTTNAYTILNVWHDPKDKSSRLEIEYVKKESLRTWLQAGAHAIDSNGSRLAFQGLVVSTHEYIDFPVDISREDLAFIADSFEIPRAYVTLLFAHHTSYFALDRQVCWYYGRPGLRALASMRVTDGCTRAIVTINESKQQEFERDMKGLSSFARHPLMLALVIRLHTLRDLEKWMKVHVGSLREVERLTGFHADYEDDADIDALFDAPESPSFDLGRLSKKIGSDAANLGNFKIILAQLGSMKEMMPENGRRKWLDHFNTQNVPLYIQDSEDMIEMDTMFECMRRGLLEAIAEYQNRARSLQSVIFTLIAKEDANASIALAEESRVIAMATKKDGSSMKTIAIMTMIFLPATFYAALFAVPFLQWNKSPVVQKNFWIYWVFTIPSTVIIMLTWHIIATRQAKKENESGEKKRVSRELKTESHHAVPRPDLRSVTASGQPYQHVGLGSVRSKGSVQLAPGTGRNRNDVRPRLSEKDDRERSKVRNTGTIHSAGTTRDTSLAYQMA